MPCFLDGHSLALMLHYFCTNLGDFSRFLELMKLPELDVNYRIGKTEEYDQETALAAAVTHAQWAKVREIIKVADLERSFEGQWALRKAITNIDHLPKCRYFRRDRECIVPGHDEEKNECAVRTMQQLLTVVNANGTDGIRGRPRRRIQEPALTFAGLSSLPAIVTRVLIDTDGIDVNKPDSMGDTALTLAAMNGYV